ncbi:aryl-sulfate sulfotransferase [Aeromonas schubertii]|uniref:ribbon-helix-helix domain-containing protein n=1 Tax=Aeromonas TaxID=642 RepID=UPI00067F5D16|nr:ribbon-helix-helix domain-containing protein [Aeromonas schubertii]KUE81547.1 aryl-sulfate sulfotransferase [Aeromonas schubertii]
MCTLFAGQSPDHYTCTTRSVRLCGHSTSIRLENKFWDILEQICQAEGRTIGQFLSALYQESLASGMDKSNFTSLLRCSCLIHLETRTATS